MLINLPCPTCPLVGAFNQEKALVIVIVETDRSFAAIVLSFLEIFLESTNIMQAPSILAETESNIDRSLGQFTKELGQMDTAVKKISDIAVDQANKYKNTMKKDYQVSHLLAVLWDFLH